MRTGSRLRGVRGIMRCISMGGNMIMRMDTLMDMITLMDMDTITPTTILTTIPTTSTTHPLNSNPK
jgi:hypothetical protein